MVFFSDHSNDWEGSAERSFAALSLFPREGGAGRCSKSKSGASCADIIVAGRPGQPRPDSAVCGETAPVGRRLPGGEELLHGPPGLHKTQRQPSTYA